MQAKGGYQYPQGTVLDSCCASFDKSLFELACCERPASPGYYGFPGAWPRAAGINSQILLGFRILVLGHCPKEAFPPIQACTIEQGLNASSPFTKIYCQVTIQQSTLMRSSLLHKMPRLFPTWHLGVVSTSPCSRPFKLPSCKPKHRHESMEELGCWLAFSLRPKDLAHCPLQAKAVPSPAWCSDVLAVELRSAALSAESADV